MSADALNPGHMVPLQRRLTENTTPTLMGSFVAKKLVPRFQGKPVKA
jgi:hypothetical protein